MFLNKISNQYKIIQPIKEKKQELMAMDEKNIWCKK
jgi:hypothetical protein